MALIASSVQTGLLVLVPNRTGNLRTDTLYRDRGFRLSRIEAAGSSPAPSSEHLKRAKEIVA